MSQLYIQRFEYRGAVDKGQYDKAWEVANEVLALSGNWGNVKRGIKHLAGYGTAWGGYALLEVSDPKALAEYQLFHINNYSHLVSITFDPVVDLDAALAPTLKEIRSKAKKRKKRR